MSLLVEIKADMPVLTDAQLQRLASPNLGAGTELDHDWQDPYPDAPCWGWALFGGPGGHGNSTPLRIFEKAMQHNNAGFPTGLKPGFVDWVQNTFPNNAEAITQAQIIAANFQNAVADFDKNGICRTAFARLCVALSGLTVTNEVSNYCVVMASCHWYTWEHWALGLANNINAPNNPPIQYIQRNTENPVNTRCSNVWGNYPLLTMVPIVALHHGHIDYLQHAVGGRDMEVLVRYNPCSDRSLYKIS